MMSEARLSPVEGALFGINMFVHTLSGMYTCTGKSKKTWNSGCVQVTPTVDVPSTATAVTAKKPG